MCRKMGLFYCFLKSYTQSTTMISRKKIFPLFYCSHLLIYTFCEVLFVLSLLNSHVWTIVSATRALPLAFPGPLPFPEGIDNYYLLFSALIFGISYLYVYLFFPIFKSQHNFFLQKNNCVHNIQQSLQVKFKQQNCSF